MYFTLSFRFFLAVFGISTSSTLWWEAFSKSMGTTLNSKSSHVGGKPKRLFSPLGPDERRNSHQVMFGTAVRVELILHVARMRGNRSLWIQALKQAFSGVPEAQNKLWDEEWERNKHLH
ncbi:hypothetical protein IWX91DRAFT_86799 [Phyllosticta citricarpa]